MANLNPKMSASYRAIFILSILMAFAVLMAGAATKSNGAGLGVLLWGYQAWLMYKRDNTALVSLTKAILWVQAIAFCILFSVLLFSKSDAKAYIDITPQVLILLAILCIGIEYFFYRFFRSQAGLSALTYPTSVVNSSSIEDEFWEKALRELEGVRHEATWARALAESAGNMDLARSNYIKQRAMNFKLKSSIESNFVNNEEEKQFAFRNSKKNHWQPWAILGTLLLILVGVLVYGPIISEFEQYVSTSSKSQKPYIPIYSKSQIEAQNSPRPKTTSCRFAWNSDTNRFDRLNDDLPDWVGGKLHNFPKPGFETLVLGKIDLLSKADKDGDIVLAKALDKEIEGLTSTKNHREDSLPKSLDDSNTKVRLSALCSE